MSWLTVPELHPDIPSVLSLRTGEKATAALASAMLAEGILSESDWTGNLSESLRAGITRWAGAVLGGEPLRRVELGLFWTDDLQAAAPQMGLSLWRSVEGRDPELPVGLLAIQAEAPKSARYQGQRDVFVGRAVRELEKIKHALGFQVLYALQEVLPRVICAASPAWGWQQVWKHYHLHSSVDLLGMDDVHAERGHIVTPERFAKHVPRQAEGGKLHPEDLKRALKAGKLPDRLRTIVQAADELLTLLQAWPEEARSCESHVLCPPRSVEFLGYEGCAAKQVAFAVRWSRDDEIPRFVDDYHHGIRLGHPGGDATNLMWCRGFHLRPDEIRKAVREWKGAAVLALKACRLAELLHSDETALARAGNGGLHFHEGIQEEQRFFLRGALLMYSSSLTMEAGAYLVTRHEAFREGLIEDGQRAFLGAGRPITRESLQALIRGVQDLAPSRTVLPPEVLMYDGHRLAWWTPERRARIWFDAKQQPQLQDVSRQEVMWPAMLWVADPFQLAVYALQESQRPRAETALFMLPALNVYGDGSVCAGGVPYPASTNPVEIAAWESCWYDSEGTHATAARLTLYPGGHDALWRAMRTAGAFAVESLVPLALTVGEAINRESVAQGPAVVEEVA